MEDYEIPMRYGWTVVSTHGYQRLKGVSVAPFGEDGMPDISRKEYIPCDTLLVAAGLIPELEVCRGYEANDEKGFFICGNASRVHDLADYVTEEGILTGQKAAAFLGCGKLPEQQTKLAKQEKGKQGNMICTVCPKGCIMQVIREPFSVTGNQCEKGAQFALQELENPKRVVTSVVKAGADIVAVRTDRAVDKSQISNVMKAIKRIKVSLPVMPGQIVARNIADTGADLVATWYVN